MDYIDSPAKRRKYDHYSSPDIENFSEIDDDEADETVATLPLPRPGHIQQPSQSLTQPTQLIERYPSYTKGSNGPHNPEVQVTASSPPPAPQAKPRPGGLLASAMAPPGTAFRLPGGVQRPAPGSSTNYVNISDDDDDDEDDGPTYRGGSSDDDHSQVQRAHDIKPTKFGPSEERIEESPAKSGMNKFKQITSASVYKPGVARPTGSASFAGSAFDGRNRSGAATQTTLVTGRKPSADTMANAYGSVSKKARQVAPSRAMPVVGDDADWRVSDFPDWGVRQKLQAIRKILPNKSVKDCYNALQARKMNVEDAMELIASQEDEQSRVSTHREQSIDLTMESEDELMFTPATSKVKQAPLVQHRSIQEKWSKNKGPTIQEKWSSTQHVSKPAPIAVFSPPPNPPKQLKRLVRGRKNPSSPVTIPSPEPKRSAKEDLDDSDEVISDEESEDDGSFSTRVLKFFNTCTVGDLVDIASIDRDAAEHLISKRPFRTLEDVRSVPSKTAKPTKSRVKPKPMGEKIWEKCEDMLIGYDAVDALVGKCESLGKPVAKEMKEWGVDVFGAKNGEIDLVHLGDSQHDSGIGTPQSELELNDEVSRGHKSKPLTQPVLMNAEMRMKDYQVVGVNWLSLLYRHKLSCILADDMGLGKTCQVIGFLAHLLEQGQTGPHLIVVPSSTLENWLQEFQRFCPALVVEPLYAPDKERFAIRDRIEAEREHINVVVTTYAIAKAKEDAPWIRHFGFHCTIFDEGHMLRNSKSQVYEKLLRIRSQFRLLLTGTPLQNNLQELISLLGFILPSVFKEKKDDLEVIFSHKAKTTNESHEALLSTQRIARARSMLTPFILRRKKHQVLKDIPKKTCRVEYCEMSPAQVELYYSYQEKARRIIERRAEGNTWVNESANILMKLRQASIHQLMFHRIYDDPDLLQRVAKNCLKDEQWENSNPDLIVQEITEYSDLELHQLCSRNPTISKFALQNEEWMDSGKVIKLIELLATFREEGARTLIFSQFTMVLDILEMVMTSLGTDYLRLDGSTKVDTRQDMIDEFNNNEIPVFMLSTKAGGAGINLAAANKIIIFDSSFNPQDDIQAENRAHRIGQTREVEVVRLISKGTIEEQIHALGLTKLALDQKVAGEDDKEMEKENLKTEAEGLKMVEEMFLKKLQGDEGKDVDVKTEAGGSKADSDETVKEEDEGAASVMKESH